LNFSLDTANAPRINAWKRSFSYKLYHAEKKERLKRSPFGEVAFSMVARRVRQLQVIQALDGEELKVLFFVTFRIPILSRDTGVGFQ
jgi:hypothetical protein